MPLHENEVDIYVEFDPDESLYRRVSIDELIDGELTAASIRVSYGEPTIEDSPSVLRGRFSTPFDVLHQDCATGHDVSTYEAYSIQVHELPERVPSGDGQFYKFFPVHIPKPDCGAHSVIACCLANDPSKTFKKPNRTARNALRALLVTKLKHVEKDPQSFNKSIESPAE